MAKKKRKAAKKAPAKKVAVKKGKGSAGIDPNQKQITGMEDDRCQAVERLVKKIVDKKSQRSRLKEDIDELVDKLPPLFKKHKLQQYNCYGKTVLVQPGADIVSIKKATSK